MILALVEKTPDIAIEELRQALAEKGVIFGYGTIRRFFARPVNRRGNGPPPMEWAPWGGRLGKQELTIEPGFRRMEANGEASHAQHRVQAPGR
jgi:hypothetical protein